MPEIVAAIGPEPDFIDPDADILIEEHPDEAELTMREDGVWDVVKYFSMTVEIEQCGNYVKCEARQMTEDEELLFESGNHHP